MNPSPIISVIEFLRMTLLPQDLDPGQAIIPPSISPPTLTPYVPPTGGWFPLPPTNPGYNDLPINPFFPPQAQPIDPNDRNQNGIPDDIDALLGGL